MTRFNMRKNEKKLSKVQQKRLKIFNDARNQLIEEGYREKFITITLLKANIMVLVTTVPICIICTILFWTIHMKNKTFFREYRTTKNILDNNIYWNYNS